jgi:hypothetical protein
MDSTGSGEGSVEICCERGTVPSSSIKAMNFVSTRVTLFSQGLCSYL